MNKISEKNLKFLEKIPTPKEYNNLRKSVLWPEYEPSDIEKSLSCSLFSVCCYYNDQIVGYGRIIGDVKLCFYIQDIIVIPGYQKMGIGTEIMERIMMFIHENSVKNSVVGLMAAKGREGFYARFGFDKRPSELYGHGMHLLNKELKSIDDRR